MCQNIERTRRVGVGRMSYTLCNICGKRITSHGYHGVVHHGDEEIEYVDLCAECKAMAPEGKGVLGKEEEKEDKLLRVPEKD